VEREDRFGRTLAYVWLGDALFNERLLRDGYATVSTFPPNVRYVERFLAAQRFARNHDRGLWGDVCAPVAPPAPVTGGGGGSCDGSYPGVCIPASSSDLDCADVPYSQFRVTGSDPHGFDGDADGVGCES
jgi:micrococcal nuclease